MCETFKDGLWRRYDTQARWNGEAQEEGRKGKTKWDKFVPLANDHWLQLHNYTWSIKAIKLVCQHHLEYTAPEIQCIDRVTVRAGQGEEDFRCCTAVYTDLSRLHLTLYTYLPLHVYTPHTQTHTPPPSQADRDIELMARWRHCALSGEALKLPVVACDLGRCVCLSVCLSLSHLMDPHSHWLPLSVMYHTLILVLYPHSPLSLTNWVLITLEVIGAERWKRSGLWN